MMTGGLGYNSENGRYGLLVLDLWKDMGFHCGECLKVMVDDKWVATRMEMSAEQRRSGICVGEDMDKVKQAFGE